jgi:archaellum component FlaC
MTTENQGYIIDVIADLQKRLASETASNNYLRQVKKELEDHSHKLFAENLALEKRLTEKDLLIGQLEAAVNDIDNDFKSLNNQIAEQKETIETLQKSVQSLEGQLLERAI